VRRDPVILVRDQAGAVRPFKSLPPPRHAPVRGPRPRHRAALSVPRLDPLDLGRTAGGVLEHHYGPASPDKAQLGLIPVTPGQLPRLVFGSWTRRTSLEEAWRHALVPDIMFAAPRSSPSACVIDGMSWEVRYRQFHRQLHVY
jgi:hypothetical protein